MAITRKKQCRICKRRLPATSEYFYKRSDAVDGFRSDCKDCKIKNTVANRKKREESGE